MVEVSENIYRVFLIVINFVFDFIIEKVEVIKSEVSIFYREIKEKIRNTWDSIKYKTFNFIRALFGFNIYKLDTLKIKSNKINNNKNNFKNKNQDFLIHSNLLAPPYKNFK